MKILFFGRKSNKLSIKLAKILKKKHSIKEIWSDGKTNKINFKVSGTFDFIICFRSNYILKDPILKKAKIAAINFHPGIPKYRGIGCANLALLDNSKFYGSTAHLIDNKIDSGQILDVRKFKIKKRDDLKTLLEKTHKIMFTQSIFVLKKVLSNVDNLRFLIRQNKKIKWSKYLMTRKKLDKLYEIKFPVTKADFAKKIRSLQFKEYRLFIKMNKKKFFIN